MTGMCGYVIYCSVRRPLRAVLSYRIFFYAAVISGLFGAAIEL